MRWIAAALALTAVAAAGFAASRGAFGTASAPAGHRLPQPEALPLKPGQPLSILIVGTSVTARGTWTTELEAELAVCRTEGVQVERLAKAGANSGWGEQALARRLASGPAPDIVVMEFAGNDARLLRGVSVWQADERMTRMAKAVREAGAEPFLATMSMTFGRERLERPWLTAYHGLYRAVARSAAAGLIDTAPGWMDLSRDDARRLVPDGSHFTPEAARLLIVPGYREALAPLVCTVK